MDKTTLEKLLLNISRENGNKIKRLAHITDGYRTLIGELLIRFILYEQCGIIPERLEFDKNLYGKPFLKKYPSFHYNISHSGEWVVCATSNSEIGVDVEEILPFDLQMAKGLFTCDEYHYLLDKKEEGNAAFYDIWTSKESYVKAKGRGLSIPLDSFNVEIHNPNYIKLTDMYTGKVIYDFTCKKYKIDSDYSLCVCLNHGDRSQFEALPILVSFNEICNSLEI
jgi:4'-phosphopantetheinyl transferase